MKRALRNYQSWNFFKKRIKKNHSQTTKFEHTFTLSLKAAHRNITVECRFPPPILPAPGVVKGCFESKTNQWWLLHLCKLVTTCSPAQPLHPHPPRTPACARTHTRTSCNLSFPGNNQTHGHRSHRSRVSCSDPSHCCFQTYFKRQLLSRVFFFLKLEEYVWS